MEGKQLLLIGYLKDSLVALAARLVKKLKLNILVVDIPSIYGMSLRRSLCKYIDGGIKMDMSHALIPIGDKRVKLNLEPKDIYIVLKLDDPRAEILYVDTRNGTYMKKSI